MAATLAPTEDLQLEMELNGETTGLIGGFQRDSEGVFRALVKDLGEAGLATAWLATDEEGMVRLDRVPGLAFRYDETTQTMYLKAAPNALRATRIDAGQRPPPGEPSPSALAAVLNYGVYASVGGGAGADGVRFEGLSGAFEARVSGRFGSVSHGFVARASTGLKSATVRLDTTLTVDRPEKMLSYKVGDLVTGGPAWGRPIRLGGVQISRRFGLRPDLVSMPLPSISGTAQTPSTLDLYVNQVKAYSGKVPAGPFELSRPPVMHGGGVAAVVLRDAMGRETTVNVPYYTAPQLLAPGLADFSVEAGFARRHFGTTSYGYDRRLAASGGFRYGVSPRLTLEGRAETAGRMGLVGLGGVTAFRELALISASAAVSHTNGRAGALTDLSIEAKRRGFAFNAGLQRSTRNFHDLASWTAVALPNDPLNRAPFQPARAVNRFSLSAPLLGGTNFGLSYTDVKQRGEQVRAAGLSLTRTVGETTAYFNAGRDLETDGAFRLQVGLTVLLKKNVTASAGVSGGSETPTYAAEASSQIERGAEQLSWRVSATEGEVRHRSVQAGYLTGLGRFDGRLFQTNGKAGASAEAAGALVLIDRKPFLSRRIEGAFAVVDVGAPGVAVRHENRIAGKTGRRGVVLLPELLPYELNRVDADPEGLAVDADIALAQVTVTPLGGSGAVIRLKARSTTDDAIVTFTGPDGQPIPVGSSGLLGDSAAAFIVGYDGEAYVEGLRVKNTVDIELAGGGTCSASFAFERTPGKQARATAVCRPSQLARGPP